MLRYHIPRLHARGELLSTRQSPLPTTGERWGRQVHPSLAGLLAACNVLRGATGYVCSNLTTVEEPEDAETAVGSGKFVLVNEDDEVQVGVDVNSMTTVNRKHPDRGHEVHRDGRGHGPDTGRHHRHLPQGLLGKYKNTTANQMLFLAVVNGYFRDLGTRTSWTPPMTTPPRWM